MMMTVPCGKRREVVAVSSRYKDYIPISLISTYAQRHTTSEGHISTDCQMIELNDVGYVGEAAKELLHLGEMILAQLNQRCGGEHTLWRHDQAAVL